MTIATVTHADPDAELARPPAQRPADDDRRPRPADPVLGVLRRPRRDLPVPAGLDVGGVGVAAARAPARSTAGASATTSTLAHYQAGIWRYLANSVIVSGLCVVLTLTISTLGGYAFARFRFPGRNALFMLTLAILMVPYATLLIPLYVLLNTIGLQNSLVGVALVLTMFQLPFSTFMMRISFESVPRELDEAAMVDGCSSFSRAVAGAAAGGQARA